MIMADNARKRKEDTVLDCGPSAYDSESHVHMRNVQSMSELEHGHAGELVYKLYRERWLQLLLLSCLALISDWVCFATAAIPAEFFEASGGHESSTLINSFFFANVVSCFLYTDVSRRFGLRNSTNAAGWAMALGCLLRSGIPRLVGPLPPYIFVLLGTTLVGMAQPFFQCAPPLLSATWFSRRERSLATATALNANQLGIAAAFVVGGRLCAGQPTSIKPYLDVITLVSIAAALVTWCCFKERPPTPPTASAASRGIEGEFSVSAAQPQLSAAVDKPVGALELGTLNQLARCLDRAGLTFHRSLYVLLFRTKGFLAPLAAFVTSIAVTNVLSAFAHEYLDRAGARVDLALVGAAFQVAIVLGGIVLGAFVDSTHTYKSTTLACLGIAIALLLVLAVACGYDAHLPAGVVVSAILALGSLQRHVFYSTTLPLNVRFAGAAVGPVQPINAELAVEVTHPFDENAVEAAQQLAGNLVSALLVPLYQAAAIFDLQVLPFGDSRRRSRASTQSAANSQNSDHFALRDKEAHVAAAYSPGAIKKQIYGFHDRQKAVHPFIQGLPFPGFLSPRPHDARGDSLLLLFLVAATLSFFAGFNFELKRLKVDESPR